ncbi:phage portal protein [Microbacterium sp. KSW-18]|uniref:Phage portal protein n=1 Tax=Microbacterium aquilitoris TaxID=3067307 RepID=A0ABU3GL36_9MICO|nr:phage portal protein [Microbacterium sp. KSW-18]MDT3331412.1 phage portal protein [Microbacterium sp. KSW-18]
MKLPIQGMRPDTAEHVTRLLGQLASVRLINKTRKNYYEAAQKTRHFGIAVPPHMVEFETTLSWAEKACTHLNARINLDGFALPGGELPDDVRRMIRQNRLLSEAPMTHLEAEKYGPGFAIALGGGPGEPEIVLRGLSARTTTGEWNPNARRLTKILTVTATKWGRATEFIYADDEAVYTVAEGVRGLEVVHVDGVAMCPASLLAFQPDLDNPFGRSRISHPVMRAIDRAQRTLLRSEITAEFFSAPQRYLLGAEEDIFVDEDGKQISSWDALIGRINAISRDEEGDIPQVSYAPQVSMQPHTDMIRSDAAVYSSIVDLPVSVLGVVQDNPDSAEAMEVRWDALNKIAEQAHTTFGSGWVDLLQKGVMLRDGLDELPEELDELEAVWRPASQPTRQAAADAMVKEISAMPWVAETEEALRGFGHTQKQIDRMLAEKRRAQGGVTMASLIQAATSGKSDAEVA